LVGASASLLEIAKIALEHSFEKTRNIH